VQLTPLPLTSGSTVQLRVNGSVPRTLLTGPTLILTGNGTEFIGLDDSGAFTSSNSSHTSSGNLPAAARQDLVALAYVHNYAVALTRQGGLVAWSPGNATTLAVPAELSRNLTQLVSAGDEILALRDDGTVLAWTPGNLFPNSLPSDIPSGITRLAARNGTRLALLADGSVRAWGGIPPAPPEAASGIVAIFAGDGLAFAQKADGTLVHWGSTSPHLATLPAAAHTGITDLVGDNFSAHAILPDGSVIAWGDPLLPSLDAPAAARTGVVALAARGYIRAAQKADGTVVTWETSSTSAAQVTPLALALPRSASVPLRYGSNRLSLRVTPLGRALSDATLATGYNFHLAVTPQGSVTYRPSSTFSSSLIIPTEAQSNVTSVFSGGNGTYALTTAGRVVTLSGSSLSPGLQPSPSGQTPVVAPIVSLAVGQTFALLLRTDGTLAAVGSTPGGPLPAVNDAVAIAAGAHHALILRANGQVLALGSNNTSATVPAAAQSGVIAIAAATDRSMALKTDGSVVTWGNTFTSPPPTEALSGVVGVAVNDTQALALKADGSVVAWGSDTATYPPPASVSSGVIALFASGRHQVALKADGSTVTWGRHITSSTLYPADFGGPLLASPVRDYHLTITRDLPPPALDQLSASGGTLNPSFAPTTLAYSLPDTPYPAIALTGLSRVPGDELAIRTGPAAFAARLRGPTLATTYGGILALTPDGTLQRFGSNPGNFPTTTPNGLTSIAVTENYTVIALKNDGSLVGLGDNTYNLLSALPGGTDFVAITTGRSHALAVRRDGSVAAWGDTSAQKLTVPSTATDVIAVAAGDNTSIALRRDGTAVAWGRYSVNPQPIPADARSGIIAVAAGRDHYLALRADGRAVQFGNTSGMSEVPPYRFVAIGASGDQNLGLRPNGELVSWGGYGPAPQLTPANSANIASFVFGPYFVAAQRLDGSLISIPSSFPGPSNLNGSPTFAGPFALPLNALQPLASGTNSVEVRVSRPGSTQPAATYTVAVTRLPAPGFSLFPGTGAAPADSPAYSHNFGLVRLATPSPARTFTLLNNGTADLFISSASLLGAHSADFDVSELSLPLTLAPGATTTFNATTTPAAIGNRLAALSFATNLPNGEPAGFAFRSEGISYAYDYDYWRSTQFLTYELAAPELEATLWGDLADPDGDGIPNLLEYATGTDAKLPYGGSSSVALDPAAPGGPRLTLTYLRRIRAAVSGVLFQVEWSDSLAPGSWSTAGVTETVTSTFGFNETVVASVPLGPTARFLRLRVTAP
jgi:alpha-tubulin suppressor-like RCC1 family protein